LEELLDELLLDELLLDELLEDELFDELELDELLELEELELDGGGGLPPPQPTVVLRISATIAAAPREVSFCFKECIDAGLDYQ